MMAILVMRTWKSGSQKGSEWMPREGLLCYCLQDIDDWSTIKITPMNELYGISADHMHADAWMSNNRRGSTHLYVLHGTEMQTFVAIDLLMYDVDVVVSLV
jgi:hypothetical protein